MEIINRIKQNYDAYGYRGLLFAAKSRVLPAHSLTKVNPPNFTRPVLLRTRSTDVSTYRQIFVDREYDVDLARTPKTIVDVGANVGFSSLYFANKYPTARIYAVEPESSNFEMLKKNIAAYPNIIPVRAAVWNQNTEIEICDPGVGKWGFRTQSRKVKQQGIYVENVTGITLDTLFKELGIKSVDILKIDIEGAELQVFEDTSKWINCVGVIMIELHDRIVNGCTEAVLGTTKDFEYEYYYGENYFLARSEYVLGKPTVTNWNKRSCP